MCALCVGGCVYCVCVPLFNDLICVCCLICFVFCLVCIFSDLFDVVWFLVDCVLRLFLNVSFVFGCGCAHVLCTFVMFVVCHCMCVLCCVCVCVMVCLICA